MTETNQSLSDVAIMNNDGDNRYRDNKKLKQLFFEYSGLLPFFIFSILFIGAPTLIVIINAFKTNEGSFTFSNVLLAFTDVYYLSLISSLKLGLASAFTGVFFGFMVSYAVSVSGMKRLQKVVSTASGVFANTGGVPLAFFFIAAIGNYGLVTIALQKIGIDIYAGTFTLFGFSGLVLVYLYFQIPLMIIVVYPALEGIKNEWREAAVNLGASKFSYWKYIGVPILIPPVLGSFFLLFASAFAAYATANVLTQGTIPLLPLQVGTLVSGDVVADQSNVGYAMGFEMIVVVAIAMTLYIYLDKRASKWRKK
jgi:putative spermidine/putrescine transport system permease protein